MQSDAERSQQDCRKTALEVVERLPRVVASVHIRVYRTIVSTARGRVQNSQNMRRQTTK